MGYGGWAECIGCQVVLILKRLGGGAARVAAMVQKRWELRMGRNEVNGVLLAEVSEVFDVFHLVTLLGRI